jgi:2-haloacid dehalogenase
MDITAFRCLSFDCYGTIIDWETGILAALRPVLARHGVELSDAEVLARFARAEAALEAGPHRRYRDVLRGVLRRFGDECRMDVDEAEVEAFAGSVGDWPPFPDSAEALRRLAQRFRLIVLSNIDEDLFAASQRALGVSFDAVFTAERIGSYKPSPRNFEYLIAHAGVERGQLLHVAQSLFHDIGPARAAGLATVWIRRRAAPDGGGGATLPSAARPDLTLPDLAGLAELAEM